MTRTNKTLLAVGGLVVSYALVALDMYPVTSSAGAEPKDQSVEPPKQSPQASPFAQGLFWR